MAPSYRVGRVAWAGMVITVLAITAGILVGGASTRRSTRIVADSTALAGAYTEADEAVSAMMALERQYRLNPEPALRQRYTGEKVELQAALGRIERKGAATDRALLTKLRVSVRYYDE